MFLIKSILKKAIPCLKSENKIYWGENLTYILKHNGYLCNAFHYTCMINRIYITNNLGIRLMYSTINISYNNYSNYFLGFIGPYISPNEVKAKITLFTALSQHITCYRKNINLEAQPFVAISGRG